MKNLFPQFYKPTQQELEDLFKGCTFVIDTNVLLNLYRYPENAREDLLKILGNLVGTDRLWLPFQAALEFQENRLEVIADQKRKFSEVKDVFSYIQPELKKRIDDLQLYKRHSLINPEDLLKEVNNALGEYIKKLEDLDARQPDVHQDDKIRAEIDSIFEGKIGKPFTQTELDNIYREGTNRYKNKLPPGYLDEAEKKGQIIYHQGLVVRREFGDLIIWKEMLRLIKENEIRSVIFVTDDAKKDWWLKVSGKTIGPRPELLSELLTETGISAFHMYDSERFMKFANQYLNIPIQEDSVQQVKETVAAAIRQPLHTARRRKELSEMYDNKCQVCGFDGVVEVAHIMPFNSGGTSGLSNLILLCPNHHQLFDRGSFSVDNDFSLIGTDGYLKVHPQHRINPENFKYHRENIYIENLDD